MLEGEKGGGGGVVDEKKCQKDTYGTSAACISFNRAIDYCINMPFLHYTDPMLDDDAVAPRFLDKQFTIQLLNVNEPPGMIKLSNLTIDENLGPHAEVRWQGKVTMWLYPALVGMTYFFTMFLGLS